MARGGHGAMSNPCPYVLESGHASKRRLAGELHRGVHPNSSGNQTPHRLTKAPAAAHIGFPQVALGTPGDERKFLEPLMRATRRREGPPRFNFRSSPESASRRTSREVRKVPTAEMRGLIQSPRRRE